MSEAYDDYQNLVEDRNQLLAHNDELKGRIAALEAELARYECEKSDMLKAMQDARRALAYAQKYDTVMEISYLKLDAAICAVKPAKEG